MLYGNHPSVIKALSLRTQNLAKYWFTDPGSRNLSASDLKNKTALVVDAEDTFTEMLAQQLTAIGLAVSICKFDQLEMFEKYWDLIVMGPGPGNPCDENDPRIRSMKKLISILLDKKYPFLAVCLSHQMLCSELGLDLEKREQPNQGIQRKICLFGVYERVGFYNTYIAKCDSERLIRMKNIEIDVCCDKHSGEVYALCGPHFASLQFHPESILTENGVDIIAKNIRSIIYESNHCLVEA